MANCVRCGRRIGGFSFKTLNARGCCEECEKDVRNNFERFRHHFHELASNGCLKPEEWLALQYHAHENGIDVDAAFPYVREALRDGITTLLDDLRNTNHETDDAESDFSSVRKALSIPEYYVEQVQGLVSEVNATQKAAVTLGKGNAAILCIRCGAGVVGPNSSCDFVCSACGFRAVLRRCPSCSIPVHIQDGLWGRRVKCLQCGQENGWNKWNSRGVTLGELARNYNADQEIIADTSRRIASGMVIGGSGYPIPVRVGCKLEFRSDKVVIAALVQGGQYQPVAVAEYADVTSLQVGGRGAITTGGGWSGGGFGLTGIVTGALLAGAMNKATKRTTIETVIHFKTREGELILLNSQYTPEQLSVMLSPAINRIELAHQQTPPAQANLLDELRELGELRASGTISEDEFQSLKARIISKVK